MAGMMIKSTSFRNCLRTIVNDKKTYKALSVWGIPNIDLLHKDFNNLYKDESKSSDAYMITEIPPPYCHKCNSFVKNKCNFKLIDMRFSDIDLNTNPMLTVNCPIFGNNVYLSNNKDDK